MLSYDEITAEVVQARVCKVIRRYIQSSGMTYAQLAVILEVEQRTLESWGRSESTPKLFHFLRLMQFFPDSFSNEVFELVGKTGLYTMENPAVNSQKLLTEVLTAAGDISTALEDGRIDHQEWAALKPVLKKTAADIDAFCAAHNDKA